MWARQNQVSTRLEPASGNTLASLHRNINEHLGSRPESIIMAMWIFQGI
jgi:hypothetical protein